MRMQGIFVLVAMYVGFVNSFSWNIVLARANQLEFYNEGKLMFSEQVPTIYISWITYDPVHNRVLFCDATLEANCSVSSYDLESRKTQCLIRIKPDLRVLGPAYDPATELLFGSFRNSIYSFLLNHGNNNEVNGNLVINFEEDNEWDLTIALDSCGGYIYRSIVINDSHVIQRIKLNGAEKEIIIDSGTMWIDAITIDQETQKIYWIETDKIGRNDEFSIKSADMNGNNRRTLYSERKTIFIADLLAVSKEVVFWGNYFDNYFWQLPKNLPRDTAVKPENHTVTPISDSAGNDTFGLQHMAAYYEIEPPAQGGQNCTALKKLLPTNVERGYCNVSTEGQSECRCNAGYSGERCVSACHEYCSNSGVCSLNENSEPVCQCTEQYQGKICDVAVSQNSVTSLNYHKSRDTAVLIYLYVLRSQISPYFSV